MKIAHLTTVDLSLRYLILPQLEAALELGDSVAISAPGEYVPEVESRGIRHVPLKGSTREMSLWRDLQAAGQLWRILRRERLDVLHTHNPKPGLYGRVLGRIAGVPIVVNTVHGLYATPDSSLLKRGVVYLLEAIASRFSDAELIQNPEDFELLGRLRIVPRGKLRLLGNGVDLDRFNPSRARAARSMERERLTVASDDEVVIGMVGRLVAEKGLPELVDAIAQLDRDVRVVVVGPDDPDKGDSLGREVIDKAKELGFQFLGMRDDVQDLYGAFDIFVLPSHREGFPRAAMEAAASGLPLVLTDIRGCRQVVADGVNGYLVPVRDPDSLASALRRLVDDPDLRHRLGDESAAKARAEFDEGRVVQIVMDTYRDLALSKGIAWRMDTTLEDAIELRQATRADVNVIGQLHAHLIDTGFLSSLGPRFLALLYRALIESGDGELIVAESGDSVVGFVAGVDSTSDFYRFFLRRHLWRAAVLLVPALVKPANWRRILETLRYGGGDEVSQAELLSMAIAHVARGRGLGARLVRELQTRLSCRGVGGVRVVVGADNQAAISLYLSTGFQNKRPIEIHPGQPSLELTWSP